MELHRSGALVRAALVALGLLASAQVTSAQTGTISGRLTDARSGKALDQAQVNVVGTPFGAMTNADGQFTIRAVPPGTVQVRAQRIGYQEQKKPATVEANSVATLDFAISPVSVSLAPVVVTATGEIRRVEMGNSIG